MGALMDISEMTEVKPEREQYAHYYGICEDDHVIVHAERSIDAGPDAKMPDDSEWEGFGLVCPVCGDSVPGRYEGADHLTYNYVQGKRYEAVRKAERAEANLQRVVDYLDQCAVLRVEPSTGGLREALPPGEQEQAAISNALLRDDLPEAERSRLTERMHRVGR